MHSWAGIVSIVRPYTIEIIVNTVVYNTYAQYKTHMYSYTHIYMSVCVCVCVCLYIVFVSVLSACVCVCLCVCLVCVSAQCCTKCE